MYIVHRSYNSHLSAWFCHIAQLSNVVVMTLLCLWYLTLTADHSYFCYSQEGGILQHVPQFGSLCNGTSFKDVGNVDTRQVSAEMVDFAYLAYIDDKVGPCLRKSTSVLWHAAAHWSYMGMCDVVTSDKNRNICQLTLYVRMCLLW